MKRIILPVLLLMMSLPLFAQNNAQMQKRIKAQKVAFITERLDLSPTEAQNFWPIYNSYEDQTEAIKRNELRGVRQAMERGNLSEAEAKQVLDQFLAAEDKLYQAKRQLVNDLLSVIPPQKIIALKAAEDAFNKKLIEMLKDRREKMQKMRRN